MSKRSSVRSEGNNYLTPVENIELPSEPAPELKERVSFVLT